MPKDRKETRAGGARRLGRLRSLPSRIIARTPFLRRWYARFIVRNIAKQRKKGRRLPESMLRLERQVKHLPPAKKVETVEQLLEAGAASETASGRALRRAMDKQERRKGSGSGYRVGGVARQPQPGKRQRQR